MLYCPFCNASNREGSRYCNNCGRSLAPVRSCPSCGGANPPEARFCSQCGAALPPGAAAEPAPPVGGAQAGLDADRFVDERELPSLEADVDDPGAPAGRPFGGAGPVATLVREPATAPALTAEDLSIIEWYNALPSSAGEAATTPPLAVAAGEVGGEAPLAAEDLSAVEWYNALVGAPQVSARPPVVESPVTPPVSPLAALPEWLLLVEPEVAAPAVASPALPEWLLLVEPVEETLPVRALPEWLFLAEAPAALDVAALAAEPVALPSLPAVSLPPWLELAEPESAPPPSVAGEQVVPPMPAIPVPSEPALPVAPEPLAAVTGAAAPSEEAPVAGDYGGSWELVRRLREQMAEAEQLAAAQQAAQEMARETPARAARLARDRARPRQPGFLSRLFKRSPSRPPAPKPPAAVVPVTAPPVERKPRRGLFAGLFSRHKK